MNSTTATLYNVFIRQEMERLIRELEDDNNDDLADEVRQINTRLRHICREPSIKSAW